MELRNRLLNIFINGIKKLLIKDLSKLPDQSYITETSIESKKRTLELAGCWSDWKDDLIFELTEKLHTNRAFDRQIS